MNKIKLIFMKQTFRLFAIVALVLFYSASSIAQCELEINYKLDGYVLDIFCFDDYHQPFLALEIESINGGSGVYSIEALGACQLSNTLATSGNGFTLYISEQAQLDQNFGFIINDGENSLCGIDQTVAYQLSFIPFLCFDFACSNEIAAEFNVGTHFDYFNCKTDSMAIEVTALSGGDNSFTVSSLGLGSLDLSDFAADNSFTYTVTQADVDANLSEIGFLIDDEYGCIKRYDFSGVMAFSDLPALCGIVNLSESASGTFDVFPTLVYEQLNIKYPENREVLKTSIMDVNGKVVYHLEGFSDQLLIGHLEPGFYHILLELENNTLIRKFIKE